MTRIKDHHGTEHLQNMTLMRVFASVIALLGLISALVATQPLSADAQGTPTLTVETAPISAANNQVTLDITLDPAGTVLTSLSFVVTYDSDALTVVSFEPVDPANGAINGEELGEVRVGLFYTVNPFDPNDAEGFATELVIARITLQADGLSADSTLSVEAIDAFSLTEDQVAITPLSGTVTVGDEAEPTDPIGSDERGSLAGFVWLDDNRDGFQDADEGGVEGVSVRAFGPSGSLTTATDVAGLWSIDDLIPGTYSVAFVRPDDLRWTAIDVGSGISDSDANGRGSTGGHVVVANEITGGIDGGLQERPVITNPPISSPVEPNVDVAGPPIEDVQRTPAAVAPSRPVSAAFTVSQPSAPQLAYPGPLKVVPPGPSVVGGFDLNPQPSSDPAAAVTGTGGGSPSTARQGTPADTGAVPLANTGAHTNAFATVSIVLFAVGGLMTVGGRRRADEASAT